MHDLTGFERDLLYIIADNDGLKGLEVKELVREYYGEEIYDGRLYPALNKLSEKGLVEKGKFDNRTNKYLLSNRGETEIAVRKRWEDKVTNGFFDGL